MSTNYPPSITPSSTTLNSSLAPSSTASHSTNSTSATANSTSSFPFPREYHFPPFFTRQTNLTTHQAQLQKWSSLILSYCRFHKLFKLSLSDSLDSELFWNKSLGRRMSREDVREVVEFMRKEGHTDWVDGNKGEGSGSVFWVWWRNPEEWATVLYDWVDGTAQKNTVLTLYELTESEATLSQEFHSMDPAVLQKALAILVKRGKAQVFGQEDQQGVKFF